MIIKLTLKVNEDNTEQLKEYVLTAKNLDASIIWEQADISIESSNLVITTNHNMDEIINIVAGSDIIDDSNEIREIFLTLLYEQSKNESDDEFSGIEHEHAEKDENKKTPERKPYDPKKIRIDTKPFSIKYVTELIASKEIELSPDFQREFVWTDIKRRSRLIESLMLRVPLPAFYLSQDEDGTFKVVDGMQRLTVINSFMNNEFKLKGLEYLTEYDGRWFDKNKKDDDSIPEMYRRRIEQTQLFMNIIDPDTPSNVKYDIFKRINTGGKELNAQEIRNSLASDKVRKFILRLTDNQYFLKATNSSIKKTRMADKEVVLRFVAFYISDNKMLNQSEYKGYMDTFLDDTMEILNNATSTDLDIINSHFEKSMINAYEIFNEKSFRKTTYINKALFLAFTRLLYKYDLEYIKSNKEKIRNCFYNAISSDNEINDDDYIGAISSGTNDIERIKTALRKTKEILEGN